MLQPVLRDSVFGCNIWFRFWNNSHYLSLQCNQRSPCAAHFSVVLRSPFRLSFYKAWAQHGGTKNSGRQERARTSVKKKKKKKKRVIVRYSLRHRFFHFFHSVRTSRLLVPPVRPSFIHPSPPVAFLFFSHSLPTLL